VIPNILNVIAIYRPPSGNKLLFIKELKDKFLKNTNKKFNYLLIGDININLNEYLDNTVINYENKCAKYGFNKYITKNTRKEITINGLTKRCIDHIYGKIESKWELSRNFVIQCKITDHYMVGCILSNNDLINNTKNLGNEKILVKNIKKLLGYLINYGWNIIDTMQCNVPMKFIIKLLKFLEMHIICALKKSQLVERSEMIKIGVQMKKNI
jgi:hypothetical protein